MNEILILNQKKGLKLDQRLNQKQDSELEQWDDYQFGLISGWYITSKLSIFVEGEYTKFWDTEIFKSTIGLNIEL